MIRVRCKPSTAIAASFALALSFLPLATLSGPGGTGGKMGGDHEGEGRHGQGHAGAGHDRMGGAGHGQAVPGQVKQMCHELGGQPPHYCEPVYKVVTSVPGIQVADVDPVAEAEVQVTLRAIGVAGQTVSRGLVVVGGSGALAGAAVVEAGWQDSTSVRLKLEGSGTIYDHDSMHVHVFPLTGP
jgi:hypothetical protein